MVCKSWWVRITLLLTSQTNKLGNIADTIELNLQDTNIRKYISEGPKQQRTTLTHWTLGMVARHQTCKKCGLELSRKHALQCSGMENKLRKKYRKHVCENNHITVLDQLLNKFRNDQGKTAVWKDIHKAIDAIYRSCLKMKQKRNGFYYSEDLCVR